MRILKATAFTITATLLLSACKGGQEEVFVPYQGESIRYSRTFNDINDKHLEAARQFGIAQPPETRENISVKGLKEIKNCKLYSVDPLTHSVPYLTPGAAEELENICTLFQKKLKDAALPLYKPIVTSVLRTKEDVRNLRKVNGNASENSSHCYGTTFDLACVRFVKVRNKGKSVTEADLKTVLAEVLKSEKEAGNIYVKYEVKQNCFHISCKK